MPLLPPENKKILSISAFTQSVKQLLEGNMGYCWLRGEISNFRRQRSGHCYFSLKDAESQVSSVLFRRNAMRLSTTELYDGLQVIAYGQVSVYEARGQYQLIVDTILPEGQGQLQVRFEQLKRKLSEEGLFDPQGKQALPPLPRTIGFVTSPTGAALQDFISILQRRGWPGQLLILPTKVQGQEAAEEIASMIDFAVELKAIDLLIVGRGGGSLEDLWPFNEEIVARAIAASPLPIISAVGHEIDFTLSDFAADCRAETPSAAAELISSSYIELCERFHSLASNLEKRASILLEKYQSRLKILSSRLKAVAPTHFIDRSTLRLDDLENRLCAGFAAIIAQRYDKLRLCEAQLNTYSPLERIHLGRQQLQHVAESIETAWDHRLTHTKDYLAQLQSRLKATDPRACLKRGFVIMRDDQGRPIRHSHSLQHGQYLKAQFEDGSVDLRVEKGAKNEKPI